MDASLGRKLTDLSSEATDRPLALPRRLPPRVQWRAMRDGIALLPLVDLRSSSHTAPESTLTVAADRRGVPAETLVCEAIERAVDYDDWFIREVEKGLAQIDGGQMLSHDAVDTRLKEKLARRLGSSLRVT